MDTSGIEPDPSRKFPKEVLSERDNQLHHVPLKSTARPEHNRTSKGRLVRLNQWLFLVPKCGVVMWSRSILITGIPEGQRIPELESDCGMVCTESWSPNIDQPQSM